MAGFMVLLVLVLTGCTASQKPALVEMETLDQGGYSGIETKEQIVIESQESWRTFWADHMAVRTPAPGLPEVDFSAEMVIAVFSGWKATGGYSIEITEIRLVDNDVNVYFKETSPEAGQPVTEALTQPFHIVKTGKIDKLGVVFLAE